MTPPKEDQATTIQSICTENMIKFGRVVFEICQRTDRQTNRETDILVAILSCASLSWQSNKPKY